MKKLVLAALCAVALVSSAVAGGELPSYPAVPPPAPMYYPPVYSAQSNVEVRPTIGQRVGKYVGNVWFDAVDAVREPVDLVLNTVTLGTIDISNDDDPVAE